MKFVFDFRKKHLWFPKTPSVNTCQTLQPGFKERQRCSGRSQDIGSAVQSHLADQQNSV